MKKTTTDYTIPDRSSPRSTRTAPFIAHQGEGVKCVTDDKKLRTRSNISIRTWNVRTLRTPGKLEELTHEMRRYHLIVHDISIVHGDLNAKAGKNACKNRKNTCGLYSNNETNERGFRLLEFASLNDLKLVNTYVLLMTLMPLQGTKKSLSS